MSSVLGLNASPPQGKAAAGQALGPAEVLADQGMETLLLELVHRFHCLEQLGNVASLLGGAHQGLHIFGEAGAAIAAVGPDQLVGLPHWHPPSELELLNQSAGCADEYFT